MGRTLSVHWRWGALVVLGTALAGCRGGAASSSGSPAPNASEIVSGQIDLADGAVVAVVVEQPDHSAYLCSGALVGPRSVLTAAHCVDPIGAQSHAAVVTGSDIEHALRAGDEVGIESVAVHPAYDPNSQGDWNDLGMIHLSAAESGPFLPLNRYPLDRLGLQGRPVRVVGYGVTQPDGGDQGIRRSVVKTDVEVTSPGELTAGPLDGLSCAGDSGGPLIMTTPDGTESIIAITSRGDELCGQIGVATRVDSHLDFIRAFMERTGDAPSCEADGRCGFDCATPDPDCPCAPDGQCNPACTDPASDPDCPQSCLYDGKSCARPPTQAGAARGSGSGSGCDHGMGAPALFALLVVLAALGRSRAAPGISERGRSTARSNGA